MNNDDKLVAGYLKDPKEWFCEKDGVDILDESLSEVEYSGKDVIRFIQGYMCDNGFACADWFE